MAARKYFWSYKAAALAVLTFLLQFGVDASALYASPPANVPDANFVDAIWVVKADGVLKLRGDDGKLLLQIKNAPKPQQAAVDERRGVIWIFTQIGVRVYGFDGKLRFKVPRSSLEEQENYKNAERGQAILRVNPNNGSAWLASGVQLRHFTEKGELLTKLRLKHPIKSLALDKNTNRLGVATENTVSSYEDAGSPVNFSVDLGHAPEVQDIDTDAGAKCLWVALANELRRYDLTNGSLQFAKAIEHSKKVASDSHGGAWLATAQELLGLDASGKIVVHRTLFSYKEGGILAFAADPVDQSIWAAVRRTLKHIDAPGEDLLTKSFSPPLIRDLAFYRDTIPPSLSFTEPADGAQLATSTPRLTLSYTDIGVGADTSTLSIQANGNALNVSCSYEPASATCTPTALLPPGPNKLTATIKDFAGNQSPQATVSFTVTSPLPPDPSTVATPVEAGVATTIGSATAFLYTGPNPIQTGVAAGTIEPTRAAVLRGKVLDRNDAPLSGVTISILNHPELGQTLSRADGMFDIAVNGGGSLTIDYSKNGFLQAQRHIDVPWQDYAALPDVVLIQEDAQATTVNLNAAAPMQIARGSAVTDSDGARQATLLVPQGTQAQMVMPDGSTRSISTLSIRATEFTVGANGPQAMPAELPPTSGYTYAVLFTADEAKAAGAKDVVFAQPIPFYVENFLNLQVGVPVPLGAYDSGKGAWLASESGVVVKILSITSGLADLDTTGSGTADNGAALGVTTAERQQLASLYRPGQSLWRMLIPHLDSPWDANMGIRCKDNTCERPNQPEPKSESPEDDPGCAVGSIIECQNQILREAVAITGTPFSLHYTSDRVPGRPADNTLRISLSGPTLPPLLRAIDLEIRIAGQSFKQRFPAAPDQNFTFTWDGKDAYGRTLQGRLPVSVRIDYAYELEYARTNRFGYRGDANTIITTNRARGEFILSQPFQGRLGRNPGLGLGGWSITPQHAYDVDGRVLYLGSGERRSLQSVQTANTINTFAGTGAPCSLAGAGDGGPATAACLGSLVDVASAPDGSLYISTQANIRRVGPDGIITTVAGNGTPGFSGDGGPATAASLKDIQGIALGPDGSLYIADLNNFRVRRVSPNGIITTVVGSGTRCNASGAACGDGGPATTAALAPPQDVAIGPDGSLYVASDFIVRSVGTDGIITTVAGQGTSGSAGDGGPATQASLNFVRGITIGPDGSLYITSALLSDHRVRRVATDGIITTVAGSTFGSGGDGGPAILAQFKFPYAAAIGPDGGLYISEALNNRIRRIGTDGTIRTFAGSPTGGFGGDGGAATAATFNFPEGIAFGPNGSLYIADSTNGRVRVVGPSLPGFNVSDFAIASEDGSELYQFNGDGRHVRTVNTLTGATLNRFAYDAKGRLATITDGDGNVTTVEGDASGNPSAIVGPFGLRTTLSVDANGYLASITNPAGEAYRIAYTADGLLTTFTDPRGNASTVTYDSLGRLTKDENAVAGRQLLARTELSNGYEVAVATSLNRVTNYRVENLTTGDQKWTNTFPDGTQTNTIIGANGSTQTTFADGSVTTSVQGADPRFNMQAPLPTSLRTVTGSVTATLTSRHTTTLVDPKNPLSLTNRTDTATLNGRTLTAMFDTATKTITNTSAAGRQSTVIIDALGRLTKAAVAGLLPIDNTYDLKGQLSSITQGSGVDARTFTFSYNPQESLDRVTDPLGRTLSYVYDAAERVTEETLPDGRIVRYTYDANGNLTSVTPPGRFAHLFKYTAVDQTSDYVPPDVGAGTNSTVYTYNLDKQLTTIARPDGKTLNFAYDMAGRLSTLMLSTGVMSYTYHPTTGELATITSPDGGTLSYTYNGSLLSQTAWTGIVAGTVGRSYNNDFRVASLAVNGIESIGFQYDADSLLTQAGGLTLTRSAQNGLIAGTTLGTVTDTRSYNGFAELASYHAAAGATPLYDVQYTRDKLGRIIHKVETIGTVAMSFDYGYDLAGRLTEVKTNGTTAATYSYDSNGNRLSGLGLTTSPTYDDQDRLTHYGNTTYSYAANGELATKTNGGQTTSYRYDELGNLLHITLPDGTLVDYVTDGRNRRIGKKMNGTLVQGFLYQDQLKPIAELDSNNNVVARFVYATHVNVPDYMVKNGATCRIITDHLGSPRLVINATDGTIAQRMDYDEWGRVLVDSNPGFQPFGFAGGLYDTQTGIVRFGARDYEAETGRWTAKDTIDITKADTTLYTNTNLYAYTLGNPINYTDPSGRVDVDPKTCKGDFNERQIRDAANDALNRISKTDCIKSDELRKRLKNVFEKLYIICADLGDTRCGATFPIQPFSKTIQIGKKVLKDPECGGTNPLNRFGATILHEAVHLATESYKEDDRPEACAISCYKLKREHTTRPDLVERCADLCK